MFKFLVIVLLVCAILNLNNGGVLVKGAEKSSEVNILRGAHFKVYAFQVNMKYCFNTSITIKFGLSLFAVSALYVCRERFE